MGISKSACSWMVQGVCSTSGNIMTFWKTNFNMPVPSLFDGSSTYDSGFMSARYCDIGGMSIDLDSQGLCAGQEVVLGDAVYRWCASNGDEIVGNACLVSRWYRGSTCIGGFASNASINVTSSSSTTCYQWYENMANTGIAGWEITGGLTTYKWCVYASCVSGDDTSIPANDVCSDFAAPSTSQCSSTLRGSVWVEGNNLHYINGNYWEHCIVGYCQGSGGGNCGSLWIDTTHYLNWVGCDGNVYRAPWRICQFCSTFSNGSGNNPSPGSGYSGALWMDTEFGYTHIAYIGCDGNKYITGGSEYPYSAP